MAKYIVRKYSHIDEDLKDAITVYHVGYMASTFNVISIHETHEQAQRYADRLNTTNQDGIVNINA